MVDGVALTSVACDVASKETMPGNHVSFAPLTALLVVVCADWRRAVWFEEQRPAASQAAQRLSERRVAGRFSFAKTPQLCLCAP